MTPLCCVKTQCARALARPRPLSRLALWRQRRLPLQGPRASGLQERVHRRHSLCLAVALRLTSWRLRTPTRCLRPRGGLCRRFSRLMNSLGTWTLQTSHPLRVRRSDLLSPHCQLGGWRRFLQALGACTTSTRRQTSQRSHALPLWHPTRVQCRRACRHLLVRSLLGGWRRFRRAQDACTTLIRRPGNRPSHARGGHL